MVENDDKTARISQLESFVADMKEIIAQSAQLEALQRKEKKKGLGGGLGRFFGRIFDKSDWGYEATDLEVTIRTLRIAQLEAFVN
jgi:hypothetical protein